MYTYLEIKTRVLYNKNTTDKEHKENMIEENKDCWLTKQCSHVDCDHTCMRRFKLDYLYNQAGMSLKQRTYIDLVIDKDESDKDSFTYLHSLEEHIDEFVKSGDSVYIHSSTTGNGKTSWALRLIQAYLNSIWYSSPLTCRALFIHVPRFLLALKDNISVKSDYVQHIKDNILQADIVVWDEIGTKSFTQFEHENILNMVNSRIELGKSNVYTSNLNADELQAAVGNRLYSRIVLTSNDVPLVGADKRGLNL